MVFFPFAPVLFVRRTSCSSLFLSEPQVNPLMVLVPNLYTETAPNSFDSIPVLKYQNRSLCSDINLLPSGVSIKHETGFNHCILLIRCDASDMLPPVAKKHHDSRLVQHSSQCFKKNTIKCMSSPQDSSSSTPPPAPKVPKVSTNFSDFLAFSGPAPERINGRLAMIGFVSAMAVELSNGQDVFTQISNGGLTVFVGTSVVLTLASLVPLFKGVRAEAKSNGVMTSDAELWNGRVTMLGLVALGFTEFVTGSPLV